MKMSENGIPPSLDIVSQGEKLKFKAAVDPADNLIFEEKSRCAPAISLQSSLVTRKSFL